MKAKKKPPAAVAYIWVTSMGIQSQSECNITEERWEIEADKEK